MGEGGLLLRSTNGVTWSEIASGTSLDLFDVAYGNGKLVAVGLFGTVLHSSDGIQWVAAPGTGTAYHVVFFSGAFYQCGSFGNLSRSTDGIVWTRISIAGERNLGVIVAGNNSLIVGSYWGDLWRSENGGSWDQVRSGAGAGLYGGVYGDGTFVLGGTGGTIIFSTDGTNWTEAATAAADSINLQAIAYGNGVFLASGSVGGVYRAEEGVALEFTAAPIPLTFPATAIGESLTLPLRIQNTGTLPINSLAITVEGLHSAAFVPGIIGGRLEAGATANIPVAFRPLLIGTVVAQLNIGATGTVSRKQRVTSYGTGLRPDWASGVEVQGRVVALPSGSPVSDAAVISPMSTVQTDQAGRFRLEVAAQLQTLVAFEKPGYLTRHATILPRVNDVDLADISLISTNGSGFDLGGYKRVLFDGSGRAPFHLTRWLARPTLYIDTTPDRNTGEAFGAAGIQHITNIIPSFIERMSHGFLQNMQVVIGSAPPTNHAIVFRLDSRISSAGASGGGSQADGEITYSAVLLKSPEVALNSYVILHETGHALGLNHANGNVSSLMASASIFWPTRDIRISVTETEFDLLMGQILYDRFPGGETDPDESTAVEYDPIGFPLPTSSGLIPRAHLSIATSSRGMLLLLSGRA